MTADEEEARERLLFHLENQTGFWFALVVGDDPRPRARVREAAEDWCRENKRPFFFHEPDPEGLVKLAVALAKGDSPGIHWILADGVLGLNESWRAGAAQMLMAMNERREAYRKRLEGGIVVEGRSSLKRILREMAPDLFSIRAFIAEPGEEPRRRTSDFPEWKTPVSLTSMVTGVQVDPDLALERLARLTVHEGLGTTNNWLNAERRAMTSLFNIGRYDEAERHARELLTRSEQRADDSLNDRVPWSAWAYDVLARIAILKNNNIHDAIHLLDQSLNVLFLHLGSHPKEQFFCVLKAVEVTKLRAVLLLHIGDLDGASAAFEQHVDMLLTSVASLPPEMQISLLDSYLRLATVFGRQDKFAQAEDALRKAVSIAEECATQYPEDDRWQLEKLRSVTALGRIQLRQHATSLDAVVAALKTLIPAADLAHRLEAYGSTNESWRGVLEDFYYDLAFILSLQVNYSQFSDAIRVRALSSIKRRLDRMPDDVALGWMLAQYYLQRAILIEKEDVAGAKDAAQQALELAEKLPIQDKESAELKKRIEALRPFLRKKRTRRRPAKRS